MLKTNYDNKNNDEDDDDYDYDYDDDVDDDGDVVRCCYFDNDHVNFFGVETV